MSLQGGAHCSTAGGGAHSNLTLGAAYNIILAGGQPPPVHGYHILSAPANCVLALPFDENAGMTAADRSGNANDATLTAAPNDPTWVAGWYDTALDFVRANPDRFTIVNDATLNISVDMTWMAWIKCDGVLNFQLLWRGTNVGAGFDTGVNMVGGGRFGFYNSVGAAWVCGNTNVQDGAWHHLCIVYKTSTGTYQFYLDGNVDGNGATSASIGNSLNNYAFGCHALSNVNAFDGIADEVKVWNIGLTQAQVIVEMNTSIYY